MNAAAGLDVDGVTVRFGGLVAVSGLTLHAPGGRLTGLIGPNGAGKTTTFNACSGLIRPAEGTIRFGDVDVTTAGAPQRARMGLGRTFQLMELFDSLTVRENVEMGCEAMQAGRGALRHLVSPRRERAEARGRAGEILEQCGLTDIAGSVVGALPTGTRRLVELGRALAGEFEVLLLDEPSSGLDAAETKRFGEILRDEVASRGTGILLVEHDMSLVADVCEYVYVLDFGELIFEGTMAEVVASPVVRDAYLGSELAEA